MDLVLIKALLEQLENIIADFDERELDDTDWENLNRQELICLFNSLSLAKRKFEEQDVDDNAYLIEKSSAKESLLNEMESTRTVGCPYLQCDEMYHAWNEAFNAMEKVVKKLLDNDLVEN